MYQSPGGTGDNVSISGESEAFKWPQTSAQSKYESVLDRRHIELIYSFLFPKPFNSV